MAEQISNLDAAVERLSQPSRVALFYARDIVSTYAAATIEPTHVVCGTLRQDAALFRPFLKADWTAEGLKSAMMRVLAVAVAEIPISDDVDVPFSAATRELFLRSALVADSLGNKNIEPIHLVVAVLQDETMDVSRILRDAGVTAEAIIATLRKADVN